MGDTKRPGPAEEYNQLRAELNAINTSLRGLTTAVLAVGVAGAAVLVTNAFGGKLAGRQLFWFALVGLEALTLLFAIAMALADRWHLEAWSIATYLERFHERANPALAWFTIIRHPKLRPLAAVHSGGATAGGGVYGVLATLPAVAAGVLGGYAVAALRLHFEGGLALGSMVGSLATIAYIRRRVEVRARDAVVATWDLVHAALVERPTPAAASPNWEPPAPAERVAASAQDAATSTDPPA